MESNLILILIFLFYSNAALARLTARCSPADECSEILYLISGGNSLVLLIELIFGLSQITHKMYYRGHNEEKSRINQE